MEEKSWNPRFVDRDYPKGTLGDRDNFMRFMNNLNLPDPLLVYVLGWKNKSELEVDDVFKRLFELTCEIHT